MAISLSSLNKVRATLPPRLLFYGPPGVGKTSLAAEFPDAVFIQIEEGTPGGVELNTFGHLKTYDEVMEAIAALYTEDHGHRTLVVDSLDKLEPLVWDKTCEGPGWPSIEAPGYGKGYVEADRIWRDFLNGANALRRDKNMNVIFIAHASITSFPNPSGAEYPRWDIRLHKRALGLVQDETDGIFLINQDATVKVEKSGGFGKEHAHASGGDARWIFCDGRPAWVAKNRFDMPGKILFKRGEGYLALAPYLPGQTVAEIKKPKKAA